MAVRLFGSLAIGGFLAVGGEPAVPDYVREQLSALTGSRVQVQHDKPGLNSRYGKCKGPVPGQPSACRVQLEDGGDTVFVELGHLVAVPTVGDIVRDLLTEFHGISDEVG